MADLLDTDIVRRRLSYTPEDRRLHLQLCDEVDRLRAERDALAEALREIASHYGTINTAVLRAIARDALLSVEDNEKEGIGG